MSKVGVCDPDKERGKTITNKDKMQDSEVRGVRPGGSGGNSSEGGGRLLDTRAFLFHHAHTQDGYRMHKGCRLCSKGVSGVSVEVAERPSDQDEVHESGGVDEEGTTAPPLGGGWDAVWKGYQMPGTQE